MRPSAGAAGGRLRVCKWDEYQHYKDRNPVWIKLHTRLLDDYEFTCLRPASRLLAICSMLLAAKTENHIPADPSWIGRAVHLEVLQEDIGELVSVGFLETCQCQKCLASNKIADCKQVAIPEKRREEKKESAHASREATPPDEDADPPAREAGKGGAAKYPPDFERFWSAYPRKVGKGDALKAWTTKAVRSRRPPVPELVSAVERAKSSRQWSDKGGEFIPYPGTWLRRHGWEDDDGASSNNGPSAAPAETAEEIAFARRAQRLALGLEELE